MPIKEKSTYKKFEFEYVSPDGDTCDVVIVEHGDQKYVEFTKPNGDKVAMDGEMLLDMADKYRDIMFARSRSPRTPMVAARTPGKKLQAPRIVDHRTTTAMPEPMVEETEEEPPTPRERMKASQMIGDDSPVMSRVAGGVDYGVVQTGVDYHQLGQVGETPEQWSIRDKDVDEMTGWQREALSRQGAPKPQFRRRGAVGANFKRIGAAELI